MSNLKKIEKECDLEILELLKLELQESRKPKKMQLKIEKRK